MQLKRKQLMQINGGLFLLVAVLHLLRVLNSWDVVIAQIDIPLWLSYFIVAITGALTYANWNQAS